MLSHQSVFGGEPSGHIIFKQYSTTGDGILAALKVIECLRHYERNLEELCRSVPLVPQVLKNIEVSEKRDFKTLPKVSQVVKEVESKLKDSGRVLLRYSGTEKLARIMVEGENQSLIEKSCEKIVDVLKDEIGV